MGRAREEERKSDNITTSSNRQPIRFTKCSICIPDALFDLSFLFFMLVLWEQKMNKICVLCIYIRTHTLHIGCICMHRDRKREKKRGNERLAMESLERG